ncbi:unnamed protein product [Prorocentrum cordatum]|uniref:Uncharacterized protein n=1 Tax=Prorocentrum cordatum TaxID=2364126 RepID=A0ABN9XIA3_9DINO|nr:unnamed protein product [Polarella glacialis]
MLEAQQEARREPPRQSRRWAARATVAREWLQEAPMQVGATSGESQLDESAFDGVERMDDCSFLDEVFSDGAGAAWPPCPAPGVGASLYGGVGPTAGELGPGASSEALLGAVDEEAAAAKAAQLCKARVWLAEAELLRLCESGFCFFSAEWNAAEAAIDEATMHLREAEEKLRKCRARSRDILRPFRPPPPTAARRRKGGRGAAPRARGPPVRHGVSVDSARSPCARCSFVNR